MKNALIIGGSGFVGGYLIACLQSEGVQVVATKMPMEKVEAPCPVYDLDILNSTMVKDVLANIKPDSVFHLAAQSSVALSWKDPVLTLRVNVLGSLNVLQAIRELGLHCRVLLVGSGEEYGNALSSDILIDESLSPEPTNFYSVSKVSQAMMGRVFSMIGEEVMVSRAFNHIGPKQSPQFVVSDFAKQIACIEAGLQEPVIRVGNLSALRDFSDVRDIVKAYSIIMEKGLNGEIYNIGSGRAISIQYILDSLLGLTSSQISVVVDKTRFRPLETPCIKTSIAKVEKLGWKPQISLEQSLFDVLQYWRQQIQDGAVY